MRYFFLVIIGFCICRSTLAQDSIVPQTYRFSLQEAIVYGLKNNYSARNATTDIAITLKQKWEIIAQGLPQIGAEVSYQNQLIQQVSFIPAQFLIAMLLPGICSRSVQSQTKCSRKCYVEPAYF